MEPHNLWRRLAAEAIGTAFLLTTIVGSGIMAERLSDGNVALALLCNSAATGAILAVLIYVLAPLSGAHFNPAVTLAFLFRRDIGWSMACAYVLVQLAAAVLGVTAAHAMFDEGMFQVSTQVRSGPPLWLAEGIATFGLVFMIFGAVRVKPEVVGPIVGLYIFSAEWFTASTSFANPAVTVARALTDTFSGIHPSGVPAFLVAQVLGAAVAAGLAAWLFGQAGQAPRPRTVHARPRHASR